MYTEQHLNISGKRTIVFMGRELAVVSNREKSDKTWNTWDRVAIYEIDPDWAAKQEKENGTIVLPYTIGIAKCTKLKGGRDRFRTIDCNTIDQVIEMVRRLLPVFLREVEEQIRLNTSPTGGLGHESIARAN
jgi:hypothetical protein